MRAGRSRDVRCRSLRAAAPGVRASVKAGTVAEPSRAGGVEHRRQRLQVHGADALQQQLVPGLVEQLQHLCVHALMLGTRSWTANVNTLPDGSGIHCPSAESLTVKQAGMQNSALTSVRDVQCCREDGMVPGMCLRE